MNESQATPKRARRSPEERLQALLAQQTQLAAQLKAQQKKVSERNAHSHALKVAALGEVVLAVLGDISAGDLTSKLESLRG